MSTKKKAQKVMSISAESGQIVSKEFARKNPGKTVVLKVNQLTDKEMAMGGLYMTIEAVKQGTGMTIRQILAKVNKRFGK